MSFKTIILISLLSISIFGCKQYNTQELTGLWQSLNDSRNVIEFSKNDNIILYINGESFWSLTTENGELNYKIEKHKRNWYAITALDGKEVFFNAKIEIVNENRIRVYIFKHHNILDVADEYYKTSDFNSFEKIMKSILNSE